MSFPAPDPRQPILTVAPHGHVVVGDRRDAEQRAAFDLSMVAGRFVYVSHVDGYMADDPDVRWLAFDPPIPVKVVTGNINHWVDEYLDPHWDLDVRSHPGLDGMRSAWCYGRSYRVVAPADAFA